MRLFPLKPTLVILTLIALMKAPDALPAFKDHKVLDFHNIPDVLDFKPRRASAAPIEDEQLRLHPDKDPASFKIFRLTDPAHSLAPFFEALQRTEARHPAGGVFQIIAEGRALATIDTKGAVIEAGYFAADIPPNSRHLEIRVSSGQVRAFGVTFEKRGPGVEYDSLGLNGASITVLSHMFDERHWSQQLRRLQPDLVIINYGTNESAYEDVVDRSYGKELTEVERR